MRYVIQRLVAGKWENTYYRTLAEARKAYPDEYASNFRRRRATY